MGESADVDNLYYCAVFMFQLVSQLVGEMGPFVAFGVSGSLVGVVCVMIDSYFPTSDHGLPVGYKDLKRAPLEEGGVLGPAAAGFKGLEELKREAISSARDAAASSGKK